MKTHKTITITERQLHKLDACTDGLAAAKRLRILPLRISTDVDENMWLACKFADDNQRAGQGHRDVVWLFNEVVSAYGSAYSIPWPEYTTLCAYVLCDAWIVGQWLAMIADHVVTKREYRRGNAAARRRNKANIAKRRAQSQYRWIGRVDRGTRYEARP